jgi:hypothetical protein
MGLVLAVSFSLFSLAHSSGKRIDGKQLPDPVLLDELRVCCAAAGAREED